MPLRFLRPPKLGTAALIAFMNKHGLQLVTKPVDLEPHEYASHDPKSGKWRRPLSKKAARTWFVLSAIFLGVLFYSHTASLSELGLVAMVAFFGGVFAQQWLRDLY